jgi:3-deoxy-manno-octulosonate cytidylyltransferase (CMP-KDO synthetase)
MKTDIAIVVPARLASQRFPRKLLHPILGKPLILWTAERIREQAPEYPLWFAVAETELQDVLEQEGYQTVLTDPNLPSGTDRIAQANETIGAGSILNVQADEPRVHASHIQILADLIAQDTDLATLAVRFRDPADFQDPNKVKVVCNRSGYALYFSRAPIPFDRQLKGQITPEWLSLQPAFLHLGLYAYRSDFLKKFSMLPEGDFEQIERLEQLRALECGYRIRVGITQVQTIGIDTLEDADRFIQQVRGA